MSRPQPVTPLERAIFEGDLELIRTLAAQAAGDQDLLMLTMQYALDGEDAPKILEAIGSTWDARRDIEDRDQWLFRYALLEAKRWDCTPWLTEQGYSLANFHDAGKLRIKMAAELGKGHWTYPELLAPDLFTGPNGQDYFEDFACVLLFRDHPDRRGMDIFERICMLDLPARGDIENAMTTALLWNISTTDRLGKLLPSEAHNQELERDFSRLFAAGWISRESFEYKLREYPNPARSKIIENHFLDMLARAQAIALDDRTLAASGTRRPGRL